MVTLFTVPIEPSGSVTCTAPAEKVYLLTFVSPPDNRLKTNFCEALHLALDIIEHKYPKGVVVTTSGIAKFYSNGLDLEHATSTPNYWDKTLYTLWARLLSYPMPTVALINGHAFAGGLMLAMMHDYRIQNPSKGFLCLNELDFGALLKPPMSSIFRQKLPYPSTYRNMVLEAKRFGAQEALNEGIVDGLGGLGEVLKMISERKLVAKGNSGAYGGLKYEMFRETLGYLTRHQESERRLERFYDKERKAADLGKEKVETWERVWGGKPKL